jgi:hypothetical protein
MPFKTFNRWLFDGNRNTKIDPSLLKYNSPITNTYVVGLFQRSGKLNHYLDKHFNNIGLYYLDKEELLKFIKKCVKDFKINRRTITYFPRRSADDLFDALRNKVAVLKNDDLELLTQIINKSDDKKAILSSLGLDSKPKKSKSSHTCNLGQKNKVKLEEFIENFTTIEIGK